MSRPPVPTPRVSVVVATNRGGPFLAEALASAVGQTYPAVDVLLVDDGSPDPGAVRATAEAAGARVLRTAPAGVSAARNAGVRATDGDVLVFLDDDDRWHPERLARQVADLRAVPGAVLGYCGMRTVDTDGHELVAADQRAVRDRADVARGRGGVMLPNLVVTREAFDAVGGFDPAYRQGEDLDLVLRLAARGPFAFTDAVLVDYRHHGANTTRSYRDLAGSLRTILRRHRTAALADGDRALVRALDDRLRANDRFAAWSAARAARAALSARRPADAAGDVLWVARFAPTVPLTWARERVRRAVQRVRRAPR